MTTKDGGQFVEELLVATDHSYSYRILSSPLPVADYTATLHVARGTRLGNSLALSGGKQGRAL